MKTIKTHNKDFFYKYATFDAAKNILSKLQVLYSSPLSFNDPFDAQVDIKYGFSFDQLKISLLKEIKEKVFAKEEPQFVENTSLSVAIKLYREIRHTLKLEEFEQQIHQDLEKGIKVVKKYLVDINQSWKEFVRNMRVFCVSEVHDDLLMWAHYAKQHTGVVLKLKCILDLDTALCAAKQINYSPTIPVLTTMENYIRSVTGQIKSDDYRNFYSKLAYTKSDHWNYEREWRCVSIIPTINDNLDVMVKLHPEEIDTIYLGCELKEQNRDEILKLLTGKLKHVKTFMASRSKTRFSLDFESITI